MLISITFLLTLHINSTISFFKGAHAGNTPVNKTNIESVIYANAVAADFTFEEENYIDDIPFDTDCISAQCKYEKAMAVDFSFEEEETIDDLMF